MIANQYNRFREKYPVGFNSLIDVIWTALDMDNIASQPIPDSDSWEGGWDDGALPVLREIADVAETLDKGDNR